MPIRVFADAFFFKLKNHINDKNMQIAFGNISWNQSYWNNCSILVVIRVIAKAITGQRRLQNIFLANLVGIWLRFGYQPSTYN